MTKVVTPTEERKTEIKVRDAKGSAFQSRGRFFIRVTVAPRDQQAKLVPWAKSLDDARIRAEEVQGLVNRLRAGGKSDFVEKVVDLGATGDATKYAELAAAVDGIVGGKLVKDEVPRDRKRPTVKEFAKDWTSGILSSRYPDHVALKATAAEDAGRLKKWVFPVVGTLHLDEFALDHANEVMRRLPRKLSGATRRHVAQLLVRLFNLAVYPCRVLPASPIPRGFLPKITSKKAMSFLYPQEDAALLACDNAKVPLVHRVLYGFLGREGMRSEEAQSLTWGDLDLARGVVNLDTNKTDDPRSWKLDDSVTKALKVWRFLLGKPETTEPVFADLTAPYRLAEVFREHLKTAGVNREELFERNEHRRPIRIHDTRATFITLSLANGRTETWVADRTGHKSSTQINRYRRQARKTAELNLGWLSPLHTAIPELSAAAFSAAFAAAESAEQTPKSEEPQENQGLGRMDSNHDKRNQNPLSYL